ncbi:hypothetical protein CB0940_06257 [Cercospora beticola]|uniref:F-box domain-containing protein n=1 Tax=Cercospora beticola TaxID=122368 RepID=A0A2G5I105_CERBT|nr:hypothetical protein CB0940_06257 [Cercospora beticola]PIA98450.1 hypothetical protein CB0940_06257 [Cercospora beticola]WPA98876.1 hypothetical protein RHO25_003489 [Cercospora beticola]CAK1360168.1 unnamed protein product [Cercospora beticola]
MSTPTNGRDLFTNLPLELLRQIAEELSFQDRVKLRTVFSKAQEDIVADLVGPILKTIYLSPNEHSICKFHRLLSSPFYRRRVRTVVYIPNTIFKPRLHKAEYLAEVGYEHHVQLTWEEEDRSYRLYKAMHKEHTEGSFAVFADYFLAPDLAQLSSLSHLTAATVAKVEGLNASSLWCSDTHVEARLRLGLSASREGAPFEAAQRTLEAGTCQMLGAVFFDAAQRAELRPNVVTLDYPADYSLKAVSEVLTPLVVGPGRPSIMSSVRTLDIGLRCMTDGSLYRKECADAWANIALAATQLEKLKMVVERSTHSFSLAPSPRAVDHFLQNERYEELHTIELNAESFYQGRISATKFLQWLKKYAGRSKLREIKLNNILLVSYPGECYASEVVLINKSIFKSGIRDVLLEARKLGLRSFVMKIDREPSYSLPCSPFARARSADASWLDELAEEMQVRIGEDSWDFGEYVVNRRWKDDDLRVEDA